MNQLSEEEERRHIPLRILLADDHPVVRIGVRNILAAHGSFVVIGEAENSAETLSFSRSLQPDILLLDIQMPDGSGLEVVRRVLASSPKTRILLLTGAIPTDQLTEAFNAGIRGVVLKTAMTDQIAQALLSVCGGNYWFHGARMEHLADVLNEIKLQIRHDHEERFSLTRREMEVVALIVRGSSNRDIAQQFHLSEETVKRHLSNIFQKLKISTRLELALFAISRKLVSYSGSSSTEAEPE